jgi:hypothetical protein
MKSSTVIAEVGFKKIRRKAPCRYLGCKVWLQPGEMFMGAKIATGTRSSELRHFCDKHGHGIIDIEMMRLKELKRHLKVQIDAKKDSVLPGRPVRRMVEIHLADSPVLGQKKLGTLR